MSKGLPVAKFPCKEEEGKKRKQCRVCGLWVVARILGRHLRERHFHGEEARQFPCQHCSYTAKLLADLQRHTDAKHPKLLLAKEEKYVPEPGEGITYTSTPLPDATQRSTDAGYLPQEVTVLPCDEVQKVAPTSHDLVLEILQHQEKKKKT